MEKERSEENQSKENKCEGYKGKEGSEEGGNRGLKRKLDSEESSENPQQHDDTKRENQQVLKELGKFKKAKNLAISMASKEDTLAQELKSMRSDFRFMQERSSLLEEDNEVFVMDMAQGYHQKKMTWRSWIQALETTSGRNTRMMFYYLTTISKSGSMPLLLRLWHKPNESHYLVAWNIKSSKEKLIAAMDPALDVKQESTLDNIYTVAELAGYCTAREPGQRPDMSYVVNLRPLLRNGRLLRKIQMASVVSIKVFHSTKWSKAGKNQKKKDLSCIDLEESKGSLHSRPTGFVESFTSVDCI